MSIALRPYQQAALDATWEFLRTRDGAPVICIPTGGGKTPICATMCRQAVELWGGRVLILSHCRELLEQIHQTMLRLWPEAPVGINSAGLGSRDTAAPIIIAGIQSVFRDPASLGHRDLVFIDECDLLSPDEDTMYQQVLRDLRAINPALRLIGLTATPFRTGSGLIYGEGRMFEALSYEAKIRDLMDQGYLTRLRGKNGGAPDLSAVHVRGGEFIPGELELAMSDEARIGAACDDIIRHGADRCGWLVFACGVKHAGLVATAFAARGVEAPIVIGDTDSDERRSIIERFKAKELRCVVNVSVLTVGFDAPHIDLIALLRPTLSARLYAQMLGRGVRLSPGKRDCLVLDFAGCITTHGPLDALQIKDRRPGDTPGEAPMKTCPQCAEILPAGAMVCNACGHEFPRPVARHESQASADTPLVEYREEIVECSGVEVSIHAKKGAPPEHPRSMRVSWSYGFHRSISEWVCVEHDGFARSKAEGWWQQHTGEPGVAAPASAAEAVDRVMERLDAGTFRVPTHLKLRLGDKYPELIGREWREVAPPAPLCPTCDVPLIGNECADCGWRAEPAPQPVAFSTDDDAPPF